MKPDPDDDHQCQWRDAFERLSQRLDGVCDRIEKVEAENENLRGKVRVLEAENKALKEKVQGLESENKGLKEQLRKKNRRLHGRQSEKRARAKKGKAFQSAEDKARSLKKRRCRREAQKALPSEVIEHKVDASQRVCPQCKQMRRSLGQGRVTEIIERTKAYFVRQLHKQETLSCGCGQAPVQAPTPRRPIFGGRFGSGLVAHVVAAKCSDSIPIDRLAKIYDREGLPLAKSTLNSLLHKASELLQPLIRGLREEVVSSDLVASDDTAIKVLKRKGKDSQGCFRAHFWTFLSLPDRLVSYSCRPTKGRTIPAEILGSSAGYLVCDGSPSYNSVTRDGQRLYCGCWAHARRKFFDCQAGFPEQSEKVLDWIGALYAIDSDARSQGIEGTKAHLKLRQTRGKPILESLRAWLSEQEGRYAPSDEITKAMTYMKNQWEGLTRFLEDARIPLDNNAAERTMRRIGIGRKNWLFAGDDETGESLAGLYSLVMSAELCGLNSEEYLKSLLDNLDEIRPSTLKTWLPHNWKPPPKQL